MNSIRKTKKQLIEELEQIKKTLADREKNKENSVIEEQEIDKNAEVFRKIILQMPYPLEVFSLDGTAVMVNQALLEKSGIPSADLIVGHYNVLGDPAVEEAGIKEYIQRAFNGETVYLSDVKVPLKNIEEVYGVNNDGINSIYQDVIIYPVLNDAGEVLNVVIMFQNEHVYNIRDNINRAIKFLRDHFNKDYCLDEVAQVANLSPYHFIRVFKAQTGKTPYEYLLEVKIEKAREMLKNQEPAITDICLACGFASPSHFASVFKKIVGLSPSEYRKIC